MGVAAHDERFFARVFAIMIACTLVLTSSFVGILALISGEIEAPLGRAPWYLVFGAMIFVVTIVVLEAYGANGTEIIVTATVNGVLGVIIAGLTVEGILYVWQNPGDVIVSQLVIYFLAAGLLGSGIAYWALHHWREFAGNRGKSPHGDRL